MQKTPDYPKQNTLIFIGLFIVVLLAITASGCARTGATKSCRLTHGLVGY
jgi:hypothetical protein